MHRLRITAHRAERATTEGILLLLFLLLQEEAITAARLHAVQVVITPQHDRVNPDL